MPRLFRVVVSVCVFASATPAFAQGASADEKELAAYTLTMPTLNKAVAVMRSMAKEMMQDPKYQQAMKIDKQIEGVEAEVAKLEAKNEMTEAEGKKLEALNEQLEKLQSQKDQIEETIDTDNPMSSNPKTLTEMEQNIGKVRRSREFWSVKVYRPANIQVHAGVVASWHGPRIVARKGGLFEAAAGRQRR